MNSIKGIHDLVEDRLKSWSQGLAPYINHLVKNDLHWRTLPRVIDALGTCVRLEQKIKLYLGAIFEMLYLADHIHCQVRDDEEGQEHNEELQFSILIGDYIFGESVKMLGEIEGYQLLGLFSELICFINEGHVKNKLATGVNLEVLEAEKASFYRYAFLITACLAGLPREEGRIWEEAGNCLGMAVVLHDHRIFVLGLEYLERARAILSHVIGDEVRSEVFEPLFEAMSLINSTTPQVAVL